MGSGLTMRIGIDIGGTFTDFVLHDEISGDIQSFKILSTPDDPSRAVFAGLARLGESSDAAFNIVHGSTVATNALLERKGARIAFVTTAGFRDILTIGRQNREHIYDFFADRPAPLVPADRCFEIRERVDYRGRVLTPLDENELPALVDELRAAQVDSVAVCLLFSFHHPEHEERIDTALRTAGFAVSISSEVLPEFREYERASTTTINAYVGPIMDRYLGRLEDHPSIAELRIMQSNGGSLRASQARREAVRTILSGPAGGVVGAARVARVASYEKIIAFDMGGTSTDVSLVEGEMRVTSEASIGGLPIGVPVIDIHTVGAGGGSLGYVDAGGAIRVGPQSAGAVPGPACYGQGGTQPTVTDANVVLGRLSPDNFLGGEMKLDAQAANTALEELAAAAGLEASLGLTRAQTAALGMIAIANAHMARAIRVISVERGHDPRDFALVSFGGAGSLHACELARSLGIRSVLIPLGASTLSAFGMLTADVVKDYVRTVMLPDDTTFSDLEQAIAPMVSRGKTDLEAEGVPSEKIRIEPTLDIRYQGQSYELAVPLTAEYADVFHQTHNRAYGHSEPQAAVEIVNLRVRAVRRAEQPKIRKGLTSNSDASEAQLDEQNVILADGSARTIPQYAGEALHPGHSVAGPAIVAQPDTTVYLSSGDILEVDVYLNFKVAIGE